MGQITGSICDAANNCQQIILDISQQAAANYDYSYLAKVWGIGFTSVLSLFFLSYFMGTIINFVKHH